MAGIGFELKKVFKKNSLGSKLYGYACATAIVSGPTFLAIILLLGLERISMAGGETNWSVLLSLVTYSMLGALLTSSILGQVLARFSADSLYRNDYGRIMPSLNGAYMILVLPFGFLYALLLSTADAVSITDKFLNWSCYVLMTFVYLQLGYLTAIKKYKRLVIWFAAGMFSVLGFAVIFVKIFKMPVISGVLLAMFLGYGILLTGNSKELYEEFPSGYGTNLKFVNYVVKHPELLISGFFAIATSFVHIILEWFGEYGMEVTGAFRAAPFYDAASFYAFLVQIPTNILFVVSVEVNFYQRYAAYFDAVSLNGTLRDIDQAREDMLRVLKNELLKLEVIQLVFLLLYIFFMRFYLVTIGFTQSLLITFYLLCVGYAALGIGVCLILLLLYFDNTRDAASLSLISFVVTGLVTFLTLHKTKYYGLGLAVGGLVMMFLGTVFLDHYLNNVDNNVFCRQPIFILERKSKIIIAIDRLDEKVIEFTNQSRKKAIGKEKGEVLSKEETKFHE